MPMTGAELLQRTLDEAREHERQQRNFSREMCVDFYEGLQWAKPEYLKHWGFKSKDALPEIGEDLTRRVIDRVSMVYKKPPVRRATDAAQDDPWEAFSAAYPEMHFAMQNGERFANLLKNCIVRPDFDVETGEVHWYVEYEYYAHFRPNQALYPMAYSIPLSQDTTNKGKAGEITYIYWSKDEVFYHDEDGERWPVPGYENGKNPHGLIPIVDLTDFPVRHYWSPGDILLVGSNRVLNIAQLTAFYGHHFQSFDQPYILGANPEENGKITVGGDKVLMVPDGLQIGLLGFNPKLVESAEMLERYLARVLSNYGLTASFNEQGEVLSGVALKVKNMELLERREHDVQRYRVVERKLLDVMAALIDHYKDIEPFTHLRDYRIPDDRQPSTDFAEIEFPVEPAEERAQWDWEIQKNAATIRDYIKAKNPDLDDDAVEAMLADNREFNNTNSSRVGGIFTRNPNGNGQSDTNPPAA